MHTHHYRTMATFKHMLFSFTCISDESFLCLLWYFVVSTTFTARVARGSRQWPASTPSSPPSRSWLRGLQPKCKCIINVDKSELHTWGGAPHATVYVRHHGKLFSLSTVTKDGVPHTYFKYLGVFFFIDYSPRVILAHYLSSCGLFLCCPPGYVASRRC